MDPKEPDSKLKFLAAEALRGVGGILLNKGIFYLRLFHFQLQNLNLLSNHFPAETVVEIVVETVVESVAAASLKWEFTLQSSFINSIIFINSFFSNPIFNATQFPYQRLHSKPNGMEVYFSTFLL